MNRSTDENDTHLLAMSQSQMQLLTLNNPQELQVRLVSGNSNGAGTGTSDGNAGTGGNTGTTGEEENV